MNIRIELNRLALLDDGVSIWERCIWRGRWTPFMCERARRVTDHAGNPYLFVGSPTENVGTTVH